jgi:kumamolisin
MTAAAAAFAIVVAAVVVISAGQGRQRPFGHVPAGRRIEVTLLLRQPHSHSLDRALSALENARSAQFRQFIDPAAFGRRFGIPAAQLAELEQRLRDDGLRIAATYPQRTELDVSAPVGTVERLFHVRLGLSAGGYIVPSGSPIVPRPLAGAVETVTGLDTQPVLAPRDVPAGGLTPSYAAAAYDVGALHAAGISGQGQRIAIVSFSAFNPRDAAAFARLHGITGPAPEVVPVDGGTIDRSGAAEVNLDIDTVRSIAPQAQVVVFEAPNDGAEYARMINRIVADGVHIISSSWGQCELGTPLPDVDSDASALRAAVAAGATMFVATGDSGAYDCQAQDPADHRLSVDWPAASADAVAVGGTRLYVAASGAYERETAWDYQFSDGGGGGGFSSFVARPGWQRGPGVNDTYANGHRQLPDVSADADPGTGWAAYVNGNPVEVGGTSAATPFWAASMLLVDQYAAASGVGRLGFVDPVLYALAAGSQPYPPFHPITQGTNRYYAAAAGWSPATGLGSPDVWNLARDVVAYLRAGGAR